MKLSTAEILPSDSESATLVGRAWVPGDHAGPSPVALHAGSLFDLSRVVPTSSALLNAGNPVNLVRDAIARVASAAGPNRYQASGQRSAIVMLTTGARTEPIFSRHVTCRQCARAA